jgi:uncharacterized protein YcnI
MLYTNNAGKTKKMRKILFTLFIVVTFLLTNISFAFAHVVVKPDEVGIGAFQTFTVGVPVEKDMTTSAIRVVLPKGLNHVTPNVKPGWTIEVKKTSEGEQTFATEIIWSGGTIPPGHREDFLFSAQVPTEATTLAWKAYQTYEDGSVIAWEKDPTAEQPKNEDGSPDFSQYGPFSETKIVNDLHNTESEHVEHEEKTNNAFLLSIFAVVLSTGALGLQLFKKK